MSGKVLKTPETISRDGVVALRPAAAGVVLEHRVLGMKREDGVDVVSVPRLVVGLDHRPQRVFGHVRSSPAAANGQAARIRVRAEPPKFNRAVAAHSFGRCTAGPAAPCVPASLREIRARLARPPIENEAAMSRIAILPLVLLPAAAEAHPGPHLHPHGAGLPLLRLLAAVVAARSPGCSCGAGEMIPGEIFPAPGEITLNDGPRGGDAQRVEHRRPADPGRLALPLRRDERRARLRPRRGARPAARHPGRHRGALRAGQTREVRLIPYAGARRVFGFNAAVMGGAGMSAERHYRLLPMRRGGVRGRGRHLRRRSICNCSRCQRLGSVLAFTPRRTSRCSAARTR